MKIEHDGRELVIRLNCHEAWELEEGLRCPCASHMLALRALLHQRRHDLQNKLRRIESTEDSK